MKKHWVYTPMILTLGKLLLDCILQVLGLPSGQCRGNYCCEESKFEEFEDGGQGLFNK